MSAEYTLNILGLGNPNNLYKNTWHNVGKDLLINFIKDFNNQYCNNISSSIKKDFISYYYRNINVNAKIQFLIPNNIYMNNIGQQLCKHIPANNILIVIYDDIDLKFKNIKVTTKKNNTHKGVLSIYNSCNNKVQKLIWIKIGINTKLYINHYNKDLKHYVLTKIPQYYNKQIKENIYPKLSQILFTFVKNPDLTMQGY